MTIVSPSTTFSDEYFVNDGIYVSFQPTDGTNSLSGRRVTNVTRGSQTWNQIEVHHHMSQSNLVDMLSGKGNPGDVTIEFYYSPDDAELTPPNNRSSIRTAGQGDLYLAYASAGSGNSITYEVFFQSKANIAEANGFTAGAGEPYKTTVKFQLVGDPTT